MKGKIIMLIQVIAFRKSQRLFFSKNPYGYKVVAKEVNPIIVQADSIS